jgi:hypothetical protein
MLSDVLPVLIEVLKDLISVYCLGLPAFKPGDKIKLDLSNDSVGGVHIDSYFCLF